MYALKMVFLKNSKLQIKNLENSVEFRGTMRSSATWNSAHDSAEFSQIPWNFRKFRTAYVMYGSEKKGTDLLQSRNIFGAF
jgi:hypothetical protein